MYKSEEREKDGPPTLIAMHFLGGAAREWGRVAELLGTGYAWRMVDLPGFGESAGVDGYSVEAMVEILAGELPPGPFVLVGHSMSGKVAMVAARRAEDGDARFAGLEGLVLAASSPAGPEPMSEQKRGKMLAGLDGGEVERRSFAEGYLRENVGRELRPEVFGRAVEDVLRAEPVAWRAWLEGGSKEDWAERVGVLEAPAMVIGGEKDADLGLRAQREYVLRHVPGARVEEVGGAGHLLPMEAPEEMARLLREFLGEVGRRRAGLRAIGPEYLRLIESERVSARTRSELLERAVADDPAYVPKVLMAQELETLRGMAERVVPGSGLDLAARLDKRLAKGKGKGWRYAELPGDAEAYRGGLEGLDRASMEGSGRRFSELGGEERDAVLRGIAAADGEPGVAGGGFTGAQMRRWFEDACAELTGIYVAHPATLARLGYSGIADGERSDAMSGFVELGMGKVEVWEPEAAAVGDAGR